MRAKNVDEIDGWRRKEEIAASNFISEGKNNQRGFKNSCSFFFFFIPRYVVTFKVLYPFQFCQYFSTDTIAQPKFKK